MSAKGQKRTMQLFDHLIGAREQRRWYGQVKGLCGLEIDHQLVLGGRLHWQISGLFAFKYAVNIAGRASVLVGGINPIRR